MDDKSKFIKIMSECPCLWMPYYKDYENKRILDIAWLAVTERKLGRVIENFYRQFEVLNAQEEWQRLVCDEFWATLMNQGKKDSKFEEMQFLMCGLPKRTFLLYGLVEIIDRTNIDVVQGKRKIEDAIQEEQDNKEKNVMIRELKRIQTEAKKETRQYANPTPNKSNMEKALLLYLINNNPCLWNQESLVYLDVEMCEAAWKKIAKRLSISDDYYYVWKYQRMWQGVMQRFLIQYQDKKLKKVCSHFELIERILVNEQHTPEQKLSSIKKMVEDSRNFVKTTNQKLAKENKRYELRPGVIKGYRKRIEIPKEKKSEESENAPYFAAMQELLKKR